ncbi:hypothetical protein Tco_0802684 [Tanacetum coccineum]|uniref:Uncharacterized protein n=1 Tax=Tanacetum coccineum TaxID=301880 RepID=A0ABQ5A283_9ASTR
MGLQLTDFTSEITDEELREFTSEYYIPSALHPEVPAASASIADFPVGKVGVYTRCAKALEGDVLLEMDLFSVVHLSKPKLVTEGVRPLRDGEEPLLESTAGRTMELARIEADSILAARLQEEEREKFTIEERAKLLHDTIAAQRRFLAQQRAAEIRSRPPTRTQLRNQMMTYLKHVGGKKHSDLKTKNFEEIQVLYEKVKRSDENFIAIGSAEDERLIKDVNKKATGTKKDDNIKKESKEEESTRKRKLGTRKKMKSRKRRFRQDTSQDDQTDSEKENDELRLCLTITPDEDKEVDYEILDKKYPIIEWKFEYLGTKPQFDKTKHLEEINLNVVIRSNGQKRYFSTLMRVLSIFDRDDLNAVYQLVMDRYQDEIPEGFDRVLWGDFMIMFNPDDEDEFLELTAGLECSKLEVTWFFREDSTMALELIRFVKKLVAELEPEDSDGDEEDL